MSQPAPAALQHLFRLLLAEASQPPPATGLECTLSTSLYTDPQQFALEQAHLFRALPLAIAHASELAAPGDALVHDRTGLPLVTVRDRDGEIRSFFNVCRHRGMRLVRDEGATALRSFVCPYHQWMYGLDGALRNIPRPQGFTGVDPAELGLAQLPTAVRHGMVWVLPRAGGELKLDEFLGDVAADLDYLGLAGQVVYRRHARAIAANWKLVMEAFLDGYHVVRLHRQSVGGFFPDSVAMALPAGHHIRSLVARNEIADALPLPPERWDYRRHATYTASVFPNSILIMHPDYTSHIALYPQRPDLTDFVHTMLVPELPTTDKGRTHYDRSFELIDQGVFQAEDIAVCVGAQRGMASGANRELQIGYDEQGIRMFYQTLVSALDIPWPGSVPPRVPVSG